MNIILLQYPKCSTCQRAVKWLQENNIVFQSRHIVEQPPTAQELKYWVTLSGLPLQKFFNTSGMFYRSMDLKNKLLDMSPREQLDLLAGNGMLVKRPLLFTPTAICIGFKPAQWQSVLKC